MKIYFACPHCEVAGQVPVDAPVDWQCRACEHRRHFEKLDPTLPACAVCGNHELYKQKDFPHRLGMSVLVIALAASVITFGWYEKWLTYAILLGTALFDGLLYLWVGDAFVCYRCHAYHNGLPAGIAHSPFELAIGERYRQERIRKEQLRKAP